MLTWLIPNQLAKAGWSDALPPDTLYMIVAAEHPDAMWKLVDEPVDTPQQRGYLANAVSSALAMLATGFRVIVTCQQGRSRSVTVACLAAALWEQTSFDTQFDKVLRQDPTIVQPSPLRALAEKMYPQLFAVRQQSMVFHANQLGVIA